MNKKVIAFAGGGTGGHILPIKSLIEEIPLQKYKILWFGNKNSLEEKIANQLKQDGYDIIFLPIFSGKIRRSFDIKSLYLNIIDFFKNIIGFFQSLYYVCKYKPEFIFSKGGFVAFMPSLAGKICKRKIYLHESDTIPGLVNRVVSKFADKVFLGFESAKKTIKNPNISVVGQIISTKFYQDYEVEKGKTNLLVIGGSQGAKVLISSIKSLLDDNKLNDFNIFIVGGLLNNKNIFKKYKNVQFYGFLSQDDLIELYKKSDISITRGSATSLTEQDQFDIKKIIVPLPYTGGNHQYYNALEYEKKGDIYLSQNDNEFIKKLGNILEKFKNYKKKKGQYRTNKNSKRELLSNILDF